MSQFSDLLKKAAAEVRAYSATAPGASQFGADWFLSFAEQLEAASAVRATLMLNVRSTGCCI